MILEDFLRKYITNTGRRGISRTGCQAESAAIVAMAEIMSCRRPGVLVVPDGKSADRVAAVMKTVQEVTGLRRRIVVIPETGRGKLMYMGDDARRAKALDLLLRGECDMAIASVHAITGAARSPKSAAAARLVIRRGMTLKMGDLLERLAAMDYDDECEARAPGEFARRGGLVDVFSPSSALPCRMEFFGDTVDEMRIFSPETQRSVEHVDSYDIIGRGGLVAGRVDADSDVLAYFETGNWQFFAMHPGRMDEQLAKYCPPQAEKRFRDMVLSNPGIILLGDDSDPMDGRKSTYCDISIRGAGSFDDRAAKDGDASLRRLSLSTEIDGMKKGARLVLLAELDEELQELENWARGNLELPEDTAFEVSRLDFGFDAPGIKVVSTAELISAGYRRKAGDSAANEDEPVPESLPEPMQDLALNVIAPGDLAVHLDYGIGIFRGMKTVESDGFVREMIILEYDEGKTVAVHPTQANKISRYLGSATRVRPHKLGGTRWTRDREKARSGVRSYAADMLRMQAVRQAVGGIVFKPDMAELRAFDRAFRFKDTPDQKRTTLEITRDMGRKMPMDRLLCGDVGYGKTEMAMRAAFIAASCGYQVAVLSPTSVLTEQHSRSFSERFAPYPYTVATLSRFNSAERNAEVLAGLRSGAIDIVIGTHRLCSNQVKFKNLGLIVIDEEQRFGVEHKERLRRLRTETDVLSMSATPIPRTLYLSMAGAKDLSTLMTAPLQRLPVKTIVAPEEDALVCDAISAEMARGGQVYYLHNRIRTISDKADDIRKLVPGARVAVAHAKLPPEELEETMRRFAAGEIDCLVCSVIIESGLDVPNANTLIVDHAERFGLAQLYQLRGRVGRWKNQAYAYLMIPRNQLIGTDARKRLSAIRKCSTLGSGLQLALHDLEIRGAGNILGTEQSGHIEAIGFDLYCHLLKVEISRLKGRETKFLPEVTADVDFLKIALKAPAGVLAAGIPVSYMDDQEMRLSVYRKLAEMQSEEEIDGFAEELKDRFGHLPEEMRNLLELMRIRLLVALAGYDSLKVEKSAVIVRNAGGPVFRYGDGRLPSVNPNDDPRLRTRHLEDALRDILSRTGSASDIRATPVRTI